MVVARLMPLHLDVFMEARLTNARECILSQGFACKSRQGAEPAGEVEAAGLGLKGSLGASCCVVLCLDGCCVLRLVGMPSQPAMRAAWRSGR